MYNALDVAKYVINYCNQKQQPISNLKLQKLLYFLWIEYFNKTQQYLFDNEIYAWKFGPVVPDVYYEFCAWGGLPIEKNFDIALKDGDKSIVDVIIDKYSKLSAFKLVEKTHQQNTAWYKTFNEIGQKEIISFEQIKTLECNLQCC